MKLDIIHQESYSRGELLLRAFFGWVYILIPHMFLLGVFGIVGAVLSFIAFWVVLFTGNYPKGWFEFQVKLIKWNLRVMARIYNLSDGYPSFGMAGEDEKVNLDVEYPETISRPLLLIRMFFGIFYAYIPHGFCLFFRMIATGFIMMIAWIVVLFTGSYPESWHNFVVGTFRWQTRLSLYMSFMTDEYPPFSGK